MNDSFDPSLQGFTPRASSTSQGPPQPNPWSSEYKSSRVQLPETASFTPATNYRSPAESNFNVLPSSSYTAPVYNANYSAGITSRSAGPSLSALGTRNLSTRISTGAGSQHNPALTLNPSIFSSPSVPPDRGSGRLATNSLSGPASSVESTVSASNSAASANSNSAIPKVDWQHSAFAPTSSYSSESSTQPREHFHIGASSHAPSRSKQHGSSSIPGLLPNDLQNDTFVMDMEDGPEEIISELKLQVESLITAIVMAKSQSSGVAASSVLQGADGVEVAHRIMNRLKALRQENEYLGKLTSGTAAAELEGKVLMLERENAMLKQQVHDLQKERANN